MIPSLEVPGALALLLLVEYMYLVISDCFTFIDQDRRRERPLLTGTDCGTSQESERVIAAIVRVLAQGGGDGESVKFGGGGVWIHGRRYFLRELGAVQSDLG